MSNYWDDDEREEGTLTKVEPSETADEHGHSWYSVTSSSGWSIGVSDEYGVAPKVGDTFVTWGRIGRPVRGQAINGQVLYYRTPDEQRAEDQRQSDKAKSERIAEYEGKRADYDARVLLLPAPLRERIEGFRAFGGDAWRWSSEPYEMCCCEEAARLVARFVTGEEIEAFGKLEHHQQKMVHPNMDDGHSGNTWGMSLRLAYYLASEPVAVPKLHAAICPLLGCEDAGCWAVREKAAA